MSDTPAMCLAILALALLAWALAHCRRWAS
jgi:MYXO-CTERM domain-containing protein